LRERKLAPSRVAAFIIYPITIIAPTATPFLVMLQISRQSIDACKDYFRDDLLKTDWQLMVELKKLFQIL